MSLLDCIIPYDWRATGHRKANAEQRTNLLRDATPRDLDDLIPILAKRAREAADASRKAEDELAEALLAKSERRAHG